ncbi:hypothetical protein B0T25DRAFT_597959 [Lasiosphaeria hispida]|uniref:Uncharacterized protein n=1 Tax=Lasiosphaeria hispida TaxID=260671 RepID=A0AAJ0HWD8_9PEZI|nr:hypothetical protein B0T25DRAFT_597959 [Lasiosphaeria hispida]
MLRLKHPQIFRIQPKAACIRCNLPLQNLGPIKPYFWSHLKQGVRLSKHVRSLSAVLVPRPGSCVNGTLRVSFFLSTNLVPEQAVRQQQQEQAPEDAIEAQIGLSATEYDHLASILNVPAGDVTGRLSNLSLRFDGSQQPCADSLWLSFDLATSPVAVQDVLHEEAIGLQDQDAFNGQYRDLAYPFELLESESATPTATSPEYIRKARRDLEGEKQEMLNQMGKYRPGHLVILDASVTQGAFLCHTRTEAPSDAADGEVVRSVCGSISSSDPGPWLQKRPAGVPSAKGRPANNVKRQRAAKLCDDDDDGDDTDIGEERPRKRRALAPVPKKTSAKGRPANEARSHRVRRRSDKAMDMTDEVLGIEDEAGFGDGAAHLVTCPLCDDEADATRPDDHACTAADDTVAFCVDDGTCPAIIGSFAYYMSHRTKCHAEV